ncbi:MAG: hypothetical protein IPO41_05160 [Acidobacteria bacterium]|nr:hypothetical protein [Acidobacteriota bacterium]MBK9527705.1 hypothetical protein [Acidobacteriota bacterium]MBP7475457.1 hypothetical protein [Pyrinomonadaceae bacterium]MBP9108599.1 hypothetical protein [Pyrinomonadaceae bacterium]
MAITNFPEMPLDAWRPTKNTLHLYLQIVGKIRLAMHPHVNHWWHVPFYVSPRGLTTRAIPFSGGSFEIEFDFHDHELKIRMSDGRVEDFAIYDGLTVADFYASVFANLTKLGIDPKITALPYEAPSTTPFADDHDNKSYDKDYVERFHKILVAVDDVFKEFRGRFCGKSTPVHLFWHSFDLALTRFSGKAAPPMPEANMVTREAYSHEVISFGFWFGDDKEGSVAAPAFYSYTAPKPEGLENEPLQPESAFWTPDGGMALLMYDEIRNSPEAKQHVLDFLEWSYQAGAKLAKWDVENFRSRLVK